MSKVYSHGQGTYPESFPSCDAGLETQNKKLKTWDPAVAFQLFQLIIIPLDEKPGYIRREQLVTQLVSEFMI